MEIVEFKDLDLKIKIAYVGGSKLSVTIFNQIIEEPPFDTDFNTLYPVIGKVNRNDNIYVLFVKDGQLRRFNVSINLKYIKPLTLEGSLFKAISFKEYSFELNHFRMDIIKYFNDLDCEDFDYNEFGSMFSQNQHASANSLTKERLLGYVSGDFKEKLTMEYTMRSKLLSKRNQLREEYLALGQVFIGS